MLLAPGITVWVVAQAVVNMGGVVGLLPVSGIPLPFVSFGGSALVVTMVAAGMLANIARQAAVTTGPVAGTFALVTGGGTGGHVYPALAVAEELVRRGHPRAAIRFVGSRRGLEATAVPEAGFVIDLLPGRGIRRSLRPSALRDNAGALVGARCERSLAPSGSWAVCDHASSSVSAATRHCRAWSPRGCAGSLPSCTSRTRRRDSRTESRVRLGARAAVSLPETPLRGAVITGNPVRAVSRRFTALRCIHRSSSSSVGASALGG